jgi:hypothetical protein
VRYIGESTAPRERWISHCRSPQRGIREWVLSLRKQGLRPGLTIFHDARTEHELILEFRADLNRNRGNGSSPSERRSRFVPIETYALAVAQP